MATASRGVNQSKFYIKTIGVAAHNLPLDSNKLEVFPVEDLGYIDGEITDQTETFEQKGVDAQGNEYVDKIETSNSMVAEWLPWGSNRYTAPNVRRGERVLLWQYADDDKYYWTPTGFDDHLRRLETVVFNISNTKDEKTKKLTSENSYTLIASTLNKEITVQTSKSDGEKYEYTFRIDTRNNHVIITDDIFNQVTIESDERRVTMNNADGCKVVLDKKDITLEAINDINLKAKNVNIQASGNYSVKAMNYNIGAMNTNIDSEGGFNMSGGTMNLGGSSLIVGNNATFGGRMINNGVDVGSTHTHPGVKSGGDTTGTPR